MRERLEAIGAVLIRGALYASRRDSLTKSLRTSAYEWFSTPDGGRWVDEQRAEQERIERERPADVARLYRPILDWTPFEPDRPYDLHVPVAQPFSEAA